MLNDEDNLQALFEMDRFVRLMALAPSTDKILVVVRSYLASWSRERIARLQATDKGWTPFDEYLRPYPVSGVEDLRQIGSSVRIRYRELEVSSESISPELRELDLLFFFANQSLEVHETPTRRVIYEPDSPSCHAGFLPVVGERAYERRT